MNVWVRYWTDPASDQFQASGSPAWAATVEASRSANIRSSTLREAPNADSAARETRRRAASARPLGPQKLKPTPRVAPKTG